MEKYFVIFLFSLFGVSWAISDSFVLIFYSPIFLYWIFKEIYRNKEKIKLLITDYASFSLVSWRAVSSIVNKNFSKKVLYKSLKFLFDYSPAVVFRSSSFQKYYFFITYSFLFSLSLITVLALIFHLFNLDLKSMFFEYGYLVGFHKNHIKSGFIWSLASLLSFTIFLFTKRLVFLTVPFLLTLGLFLTEGRSYYMGFFVSFLVFVAFSIYGKHYKKVILSIITVVVTFIVSLNLSDRVDDKVVSIYTGIKQENSIRCRLYMWETAIELFKENPFFGVGFLNWGNYFEHDRCTGYHAHNIYLHELAETGIVGFSFLVLLFLSVLFLLVKNYKKVQNNSFLSTINLSAILTTINFMTGSFFEPSLVKSVVLIPTFTIIGFALGTLNKQSRRN